jgi:DNA-binding transcriptional regulator YiaG
MAPEKRVFHLVDPMELEIEPLDRPNENWRLAPVSTAEEIRALRKRLHFTQREFAGYFGFPVATLRHWENGDREPTGCAYVLLQVIPGLRRPL